MKPFTSESKAWEWLAETWQWVAEQGNHSRNWSAHVAGQSCAGLCSSLLAMIGADLISRSLYRTMINTAYRNRPAATTFVGGFWWTNDEEGSAQRAAFCLQMAKLSEEVGHGHEVH